MIWLLFAAVMASAVPASLRWLRIAQREHYLAPAVTRFAWRWWAHGPVNSVLALLGLAGVVSSLIDPMWGLLAAVAQIGPIGLTVRGRTSPLAWTTRMRRLGLVTGVVFAALALLGAIFEVAALIVGALVALPLIIDAALVALAPIETRLGNRWVEKAANRLESTGARVVAITGSYGKTSTKQYVQHLISPTLRSVASPASFNNRMGLARAINEHLVAGTEVFIAEMGTYGPGEIADMCGWMKPDVAAIVSIGPVHLERFGSEENIVAAKSEILDRARIGVIAIDHSLLEALVGRRDGIEIITVSETGKSARVTCGSGAIAVDGASIGVIPDDIFPTNLGVAVGISLALGVDVDPNRFQSLPRPEHRQSVVVSPGGFTIIDDTFNSNPAGAARALDSLSGYGGKKVLVTPGMVELGTVQYRENLDFARAAADVCDEIIVVGGTNREALSRGAGNGPASVTVVANREAAVELVRERLGAGDVVLYENDLPDHYP